MRRRDPRLDDRDTCPHCGHFTDGDPCAGERAHDEGFDRCGCDEIEPEVSNAAAA
jgi:transcription elongation factor Elf1